MRAAGRRTSRRSLMDAARRDTIQPASPKRSPAPSRSRSPPERLRGVSGVREGRRSSLRERLCASDGVRGFGVARTAATSSVANGLCQSTPVDARVMCGEYVCAWVCVGAGVCGVRGGAVVAAPLVSSIRCPCSQRRRPMSGCSLRVEGRRNGPCPQPLPSSGCPQGLGEVSHIRAAPQPQSMASARPVSVRRDSALDETKKSPSATLQRALLGDGTTRPAAPRPRRFQLKRAPRADALLGCSASALRGAPIPLPYRSFLRRDRSSDHYATDTAELCKEDSPATSTSSSAGMTKAERTPQSSDPARNAPRQLLKATRTGHHLTQPALHSCHS